MASAGVYSAYFQFFSEIIGALQDPDAGVEATNHLRGGNVFKNCFKGSRNVLFFANALQE